MHRLGAETYCDVEKMYTNKQPRLYILQVARTLAYATMIGYVISYSITVVVFALRASILACRRSADVLSEIEFASVP